MASRYPCDRPRARRSRRIHVGGNKDRGMRVGPIFLLCALSTTALAAPAATPTPEAAAATVTSPKKTSCFSAAETREEIKEHGLKEPFAALKSAAQHYKAEALSAKLCRIDDEFIYEIAMLHKDGRYVHAHVNATTGKLVEIKRVVVPPPKT
jgi:hypothetical protein